jgi:acyl-CoA thioester hydrolase
MEIARWEAFRELGISYKYIEESDILMPVIDMELQFIKPIFYDDLVKIGLEFHIDRPTKLGVRYLMHNQSAELIHRAKTTLAFLHKSTKKPCAMPDFIKEKLSEAYDLKILN